jgi:hypothetical protein
MMARIGVMRALNRHVERVLIRRANILVGGAGSWRAIDDTGRADIRGDETSFPQIELKAQSIGDFIDSPLISNQIAGRRNHCRLPPVGAVFSNLNIDLIYSQRRNNHIG